ncbi:NAD(P)/FAD-dependent oxidoreductase [Acholeplasma granularum]|uniref:NAD(P)/FAD-dependent oxidoreductase n=1 Tax=Acholeplasma granularum TaxID=264635 RepID=UPI0004B8277A|nr:FAD-dependent oxidoreductase [Acholeplasma granularum]
MLDLIIIGSGPAGMTAAIYAKRANLKVMMLEKSAPGGQMVDTAEIENYPGYQSLKGYELATHMFEHVLSLGCEVNFQEVITIKDFKTYKEVHTENQVFQTKAVLIATGVVPRKLEIPGEFEYSSQGISWCAICDGPLYKDKKVVVIGGGNSAVEEALFLSNIASHVTLVQNLKHLTADKKAQDLLKKAKNVDFIYEAKVLEFLGDDKLTGVRVETKEGIKDIQTDGVFEYVGLIPATSFLRELNLLDEIGYVITNDEFETNITGIFSAGDCNVKKIRQIVTAVSDGALATQHIIKYLENL